jgi:alpha-beta hydrolase superfamily lysophospholipase
LQPVLLAALAVLCLAPPARALRPVRGYPSIPSDYGIVYRPVAFTTRDSITLRGWFYPAQDTSGIANQIVGRLMPVPSELRRAARPYRTLRGAARPTIVICDGDAGNMADLIYYAYSLFTRGFNVLTFDWRGFGESDPWPLDENRLCAAEFLDDYDAALDFVVAQPEVGRARIGLLGFSTGAYLSFAEAARRPQVGAVACRALLTSFDDLLSVLKSLTPERPWTAPPDYPRDLLPIEAARGMRVPVFLVVGADDPRTPPWMSRKIHRELRGPKELWVVPGAGHGGARAPEISRYPEFFVRVAGFFGRHLGKERSTVPP